MKKFLLGVAAAATLCIGSLFPASAQAQWGYGYPAGGYYAYRPSYGYVAPVAPTVVAPVAPTVVAPVAPTVAYRPYRTRGAYYYPGYAYPSYSAYSPRVYTGYRGYAYPSYYGGSYYGAPAYMATPGAVIRY